MKLVYIAQCNNPKESLENFHEVVASFEESADISDDKSIIVTRDIHENVINRFKKKDPCCNPTLDVVYVETEDGKSVYKKTV